MDKKHLLLWCLCILNQKSLFLYLYLLSLFSTLLLEPLIYIPIYIYIYTHTHTHTHTLYYLFHFKFYSSKQVKNNMLILTQIVMDLPAIQETQVWSLGQKDPLEKGMATHSSILAWRIPWTEEPGGLQFMGSLQYDMTEQLILSLSKVITMSIFLCNQKKYMIENSRIYILALVYLTYKMCEYWTRTL